MQFILAPLAIILGVFVLVGVIWLAIKLFGLLGRLLGRVFGTIGGIISDVFRFVGAVIVALIFVPLVIGNIFIGRWSATAHFGRALSSELKTAGTCLYRAFIGRPLYLFGLHGLTEGIERRLPDAIAHAPGRDKPSGGKAKAMFEGYTIIGSLAGGGSGGKLYIAEPDEMKRAALAKRGAGDVERVVIKTFSLDDGSSLPQIVRESRALDAAKKLGLVLEHDLAPERFHYVMRYVPGDSLATATQRLHADAPSDGLDVSRLRKVMGYAGDLLESLDRYHQGGLWHKDVKPDNIIVDSNEDPALGRGRAHLVDFGLITPLRSAMTLTTHGTEYFRDPELVRQALRGAKVHQIDGARFDVYAAGAVLFSAVENSFPAHGGLSRVTKRCPEAVRWIIRRAMTDYDKRYPTANAMLADLRAVLSSADPFAMKPAELPSMRGGGVDLAPEPEAPIAPVEPITVQAHRPSPAIRPVAAGDAFGEAQFAPPAGARRTPVPPGERRSAAEQLKSARDRVRQRRERARSGARAADRVPPHAVRPAAPRNFTPVPPVKPGQGPTDVERRARGGRGRKGAPKPTRHHKPAHQPAGMNVGVVFALFLGMGAIGAVGFVALNGQQRFVNAADGGSVEAVYYTDNGKSKHEIRGGSVQSVLAAFPEFHDVEGATLLLGSDRFSTTSQEDDAAEFLRDMGVRVITVEDLDQLEMHASVRRRVDITPPSERAKAPEYLREMIDETDGELDAIIWTTQDPETGVWDTLFATHGYSAMVSADQALTATVSAALVGQDFDPELLRTSDAAGDDADSPRRILGLLEGSRRDRGEVVRGITAEARSIGAEAREFADRTDDLVRRLTESEIAEAVRATDFGRVMDDQGIIEAVAKAATTAALERGLVKAPGGDPLRDLGGTRVLIASDEPMSESMREDLSSLVFALRLSGAEVLSEEFTDRDDRLFRESVASTAGLRRVAEKYGSKAIEKIIPQLRENIETDAVAWIETRRSGRDREPAVYLIDGTRAWRTSIEDAPENFYRFVSEDRPELFRGSRAR